MDRPTSTWCFFARESCGTFKDGKAKDGESRCVRRHVAHTVERATSRSQKAADAYRKGSEGKQMGQSKSPSVSADPLACRQVTGGKKSDLEQGKKDPRRRRHHLEGCRSQDRRSASLETTRLSPTTTTEDIHTQEKREETPFEHTDGLFILHLPQRGLGIRRPCDVFSLTGPPTGRALFLSPDPEQCNTARHQAFVP